MLRHYRIKEEYVKDLKTELKKAAKTQEEKYCWYDYSRYKDIFKWKWISISYYTADIRIQISILWVGST